jgi:hypothetical protein
MPQIRAVIRDRHFMKISTLMPLIGATTVSAVINYMLSQHLDAEIEAQFTKRNVPIEIQKV